MHTSIYTVYIYILYRYKISLQAWVCSFSNTTTSKCHTVTPVCVSTAKRPFSGALVSFLALHKILIRSQSNWWGSCLRTGLIVTWGLEIKEKRFEARGVSLSWEPALWWKADTTWSIMGVTLRERKENDLVICPCSTQPESERYVFK